MHTFQSAKALLLRPQCLLDLLWIAFGAMVALTQLLQRCLARGIAVTPHDDENTILSTELLTALLAVADADDSTYSKEGLMKLVSRNIKKTAAPYLKAVGIRLPQRKEAMVRP